MDVRIDLSTMWDASVEVRDDRNGACLVFGDVEISLRSEQIENLKKSLEVE